MRKAIDAVMARLRSVVARGHVTRIGQGTKHTEIQAEDWRVTSNQNVPFLQQAGIAVNPGTGEGVEVLMADVGADTAHRVAIVITAANPEQADENEIIIYAPNDPENRVRINRDGICIEANGQSLIDLIQQGLTAAIGNDAVTMTTVQTNLNDMKC